MKTLNNKELIQKTNCEIRLYRFKHEVYFFNNLIGFHNEYHEPSYKRFMMNLYGYNHTVFDHNDKLNIRYPGGVLKRTYKEWLRQ